MKTSVLILLALAFSSVGFAQTAVQCTVSLDDPCFRASRVKQVFSFDFKLSPEEYADVFSISAVVISDGDITGGPLNVVLTLPKPLDDEGNAVSVFYLETKMVSVKSIILDKDKTTLLITGEKRKSAGRNNSVPAKPITYKVAVRANATTQEFATTLDADALQEVTAFSK